MSFQIFWGSLILVACSIVHVLVLIAGIRLTRWIGMRFKNPRLDLRIAVFLGAALGAIVAAHTIQIWTWAFAFVFLGALPDLPDAIYFALVTYTTLGYGDITLGEGTRVFGAMAAVTGLLNFGLSTAFLIAVFSKVLPADLVEGMRASNHAPEQA